jgi:hypothetical protein
MAFALLIGSAVKAGLEFPPSANPVTLTLSIQKRSVDAFPFKVKETIDMLP